jgi:hypothetical protein
MQANNHQGGPLEKEDETSGRMHPFLWGSKAGVRNNYKIIRLVPR